MKLYAYVDGQLKFTVVVNVPYEYLNHNRRAYYGIKGSEELLTVYKQIEEQLKNFFDSNEKLPPIEQLNLDETNLNEYIIKKFPQLQQLELRTDGDNYTSSITNLFGKQYGYPLVWLNCNKYNHFVTSSEKKHQWERCIYGEKLNSLDKIGSLIQHFKETPEDLLYQGNYNAWLGSVKNSFTDNLLSQTRQGSNVVVEIASMQDFQHDKQFAFYDNPAKKQMTYITSNMQNAIKDSIEKKLFDSNTVKILFPVEFSSGGYAHVVMGAITLTKPEDLIQCTITIYDALMSDPFFAQQQKELGQIKAQIEDIFADPIEVSTETYNMKYQLPLQTHCGRFVITWMAAEVAGLNITKLNNYNEPFNYIFGQVAKKSLCFDSKYPRIHPEKAVDDFKLELKLFLEQRRIEFAKQWTSAGKEDFEIVNLLLALLETIGHKDVDNSSYLKRLEELASYIELNPNLKNIVDNGMVNLGYGSFHSFLINAKSSNLFISRAGIDRQYKEIDERIEKNQEDLSHDFDEEGEHDNIKALEEEFLIEDIDGRQLASDILPGKILEEQLKFAQTNESQQKLEDEVENREDEEKIPGDFQIPTK